MKFAEHLAAHITPEWRKQYINYEVCTMPVSEFQLKLIIYYESKVLAKTQTSELAKRTQ